MVVPICGLQLKIAIVPGAAPFLISNTLLRALGAMVDTGRNKLVLPKHDTEIPLQLSEKGLHLVDVNMLLQVGPTSPQSSKVAETFAHESREKPEIAETQVMPGMLNSIDVNQESEPHAHAHANTSNESHSSLSKTAISTGEEPQPQHVGDVMNKDSCVCAE